MEIDEQLRLLASHAVSASAGSFDGRRARSEILTVWANVRPKNAKALGTADAVLGALREASEPSLKAPPYILIQAVAVIADVIGRPSDPEAGKVAMADPMALIGRLVSADEITTLRRLYEAPEVTRGRTAMLTGAAGVLGVGAGFVLSHLMSRTDKQDTGR